jgi:arsenate reductase
MKRKADKILAEMEGKEDTEKRKKMRDEDILDAMIKYPKLIERPIVIKDNKAVIGRPTEKIYDLLK